MDTTLDVGQIFITKKRRLWSRILQVIKECFQMLPGRSNGNTRHFELKIPARRIQRLLNYIDSIGFDPRKLAAQAGLNYDYLVSLSPHNDILAIQYSRLYQHAVEHMQQLKQPIPWAGGMGTDAFRMMCYCIISCKTLGKALARAQRYDHLLFPLVGYRIALETSTRAARLTYDIDTERPDGTFSPKGWDWGIHYNSIANSSGLRVWYAFIGWLTGRTVELNRVNIAAGYVTQAYHDRIQSQFGCPISYNAEYNTLEFAIEALDLRLVQHSESLEEFLENLPYWLISTDCRPASTSAAIKSLLGNDFSGGLPSFEIMADNLHMSTSSLRRRLLKENTSYQQLKDQSRCQVAIEYLCRGDMKIQDIGARVGFTETSSFVRSFRSWTGMTPKGFREEHGLVTP
jgi:AraC-like DNA-binding protein